MNTNQRTKEKPFESDNICVLYKYLHTYARYGNQSNCKYTQQECDGLLTNPAYMAGATTMKLPRSLPLLYTCSEDLRPPQTAAVIEKQNIFANTLKAVMSEPLWSVEELRPSYDISFLSCAEPF